MDAGVEHPQHVRTLQRRQRVRFPDDESLLAVGQQLQSEVAADLRVANAVHDTVASLAEVALDLVALGEHRHRCNGTVAAMPALGLSCNSASGRVTVRGVAISGGNAEEVFLHRTVA